MLKFCLVGSLHLIDFCLLNLDYRSVGIFEALNFRLMCTLDAFNISLVSTLDAFDIFLVILIVPFEIFDSFIALHLVLYLKELFGELFVFLFGILMPFLIFPA